MKVITAVIQPHKLDDTREALANIGITGMTITHVKGFGRQKGHTELYRGAEYAVEFLPKVKVEIAVLNEQMTKTIETIVQAARTQKVGDGKIFVHNLETIIRIRTGETDSNAI